MPRAGLGAWTEVVAGVVLCANESNEDGLVHGRQNDLSPETAMAGGPPISLIHCWS